MWRYILVLPLLCLLSMIAQAFVTENLPITIDESKTVISFDTEPPQVTLFINNSQEEAFPVFVYVELVGLENQILAKVVQYEQLKLGESQIKLKFSSDVKSLANSREVIYYRLRYSISNNNNKLKRYSGIISLSEILPTAFELKVVSSRQAMENSLYQVRVLASHPITNKPIEGVSVNGEIVLSESESESDKAKKQVLRASSITSKNGQATFNFILPKKVPQEELELKIIGKLGVFSQELTKDINFNKRLYLLVNTDKPIYQPEQTLYIRVLAVNSSKQVVSNQKVTVRISDQEDTIMFRDEFKTSEFGIASTSWAIPNNARLGDYLIETELEGDEYENTRIEQQVKISRYELPQFTVSTKSDRSYYLLGQNATLTVKADYLFGKPVKQGKVKVVRESERRWNFREQKWEITEGEVYTGDLNDKGEFTTTVDLSKYEDSVNSYYYKSYNDIEFTAYVTDASTNRTEQRRFDLRLSKYDIHIYKLSQKGFNPKIPIEFYLAAYYADGRPAQCEISLYEKYDSNYSDPENITKLVGRLLATTQTNRYGVAKVQGLTFPDNLKPNSNYSEIVCIAYDKTSSLGFEFTDIYLSNGLSIKVSTDKTIYSSGEPIEVTITSSEKEIPLIVDVVGTSSVIYSQDLLLTNGVAKLTIPYDEKFKDVLTVLAYSAFGSEKVSSYDFPGDSRSIIYPRSRDLNLKVVLDKEDYKPGEEVKASFQTRNINGGLTKSALGITVFDKAVEERAKTDQAFGGRYNFYSVYSSLRGYYESVGGLTLRDLELLDLSKPISKDLDETASLVLSNENYFPEPEETNRFPKNYQSFFNSRLHLDLDLIEKTLESAYKITGSYPKGEKTFRALLGTNTIFFDYLKDPWEMSYHLSFSTEEAMDIMRIVSNGADKKLNTKDDIVALEMRWPYFQSYGEILNRVAINYHEKTGSYINNFETLKVEMLKQGIDTELLQNPYGYPYSFSFEADQVNVFIKVTSKYIPLGQEDTKEFLVWTSKINYQYEVKSLIQKALNNYLEETNIFPNNKIQFEAALAKAGIDFSKFKDPFGQSYSVVFKTDCRYQDINELVTYTSFGGESKQKIVPVPVTQKVSLILFMVNKSESLKQVRSFVLAEFSHIETIESSQSKELKPTDVSFADFNLGEMGTGALKGIVTDVTGAVIAGAYIEVTNVLTKTTYKVSTGENGEYLLPNLVTGVYSVAVMAEGFRKCVIEDVRIVSSTLISLNIILEISGTAEIVTVSGEEIKTVETTNVEVKQQLIVTDRKLNDKVAVAKGQMSTPRLREYFPETLLWQPEVLTDQNGQATLNFKLADNITTWKMSVIGSTIDGEITTTETEIQSFQPFFVELDPPSSLTEGDEVAMPIILRNYLNNNQNVTLEVTNQDWFTAKSPLRKEIMVLANSFLRETFAFRADIPLNKASQQVTVLGTDANDAIRRTVNIFPNGEEISEVSSKILFGSSLFNVSIPGNALKNGRYTELKIYPNLLAHLVESVEAILQRPYGCGEQTISSTYPSLLLLKHFQENSKPLPKEAQKAQRYLKLGYERLLNYKGEGGGFTYWGRGEEDIALTAYAIRFLSDAYPLTDVDNDIIKDAKDWLLRKQTLEGKWSKYTATDNIDVYTVHDTLLTAMVGLMLARTSDGFEPKVNASLKKAMEYLAKAVDKIDEPYLLACYAQIAMKLKDNAETAKTINKLLALAHKEGESSYWKLETNTPFYGWGLTGRIETTALVIQALTQSASFDGQNSTVRNALIDQGLLFLLKNKDRYGVWYSGQATINVLDSLLTLVNKREESLSNGKMAEIYIDGNLVKTLDLPPADQLASPINLDLTSFITNKTSQIEVKNVNGNVQVINNYYLPWAISTVENIPTDTLSYIGSTTSSHTSSATFNSSTIAIDQEDRSASELRLTINFDKTQAKVGDKVTCQVNAERVGHRGYGMMLAEVGLPPGAEVDRESLEKAMLESQWFINHYDVLPDRVIFYLWPKAGGVNFSFTFSERFAINALTTRSLMYDYYNPEAKVTITPTKFVILEK